MKATRNLIIAGTGGFAKEVLHLVEQINHHASLPFQYAFLGFSGPESGGMDDYLGTDEEVAEAYKPEETYFAIGVGAPHLRKMLAAQYIARGFQPVSLIHPKIFLSPSVTLGEGVILCAGAQLTVDIHLGDFCVLNLNATVGHDVRVGRFTNISPGANISGGCLIGEEVMIGSGAVLLPEISVGMRVTVGAGAVVTKNIGSGKTVMGVPARPKE